MKFFVQRIVICIMIVLLIGAVPASAVSMVSPGLSHFATEVTMAKSGLLYSEINFSADDFCRALNRSKLGSITVASLPPAVDGKLKLGSSDVKAGQVIAQSSLGLLRFVPASSAVRESSFSFSCADSGYAISCALYILPEVNFAPTVSLAEESTLAVSTHRSVSCFGTLPAYDPEGDALTFEIVSAPKKGTVTLMDKSCGDYRYTPTAGKTGRDSFRYVVRDKYGNYSAAATVTVRIEKPKTSVVYSDMTDHWAHNAALTMTELGIMQGKQVGTLTCFAPAETVTRGEFLVMAMNTLGMTDLPAVTNTGFADDADIPLGMKGYVAAARELGFVQGRADGSARVFCADETITRAEAAVMLSNMIDPDVPTVKPVFADADGVPAWAADALSALSALGVFNGTGSGMIAANTRITRAQAAEILCAIRELN